MKCFMFLFFAAILFCTVGLDTAAAQEIIVANGTGFTIQALGLVDSSSSDEAQDLLGSDTLAPGDGLRINISGSPKGWELIAQDGSGNQVNWQDLDLSGVKKITLHADGTADLE